MVFPSDFLLYTFEGARNQSSIKIETIDIPEDILVIFDVVQHTQHKEKDIKLDATIVRCKTFADVQRVLGALQF